MLPRHAISDAEWDRIEGLLPRHGPEGNRRLFVDAILYVARTGIPWDDLPARFGKPNTVWKRFDRWARTGVGAGVRGPAGSGRRVADPRLDHHPRPPARRRRPKKAGDQALGRSRGGFGTKIHAAVTGLGLPARLILTPGQRQDVTQAEALLDGLSPKVVIADRGYDSRALVASIEATGAEAVIPTQSDRSVQRVIDREREGPEPGRAVLGQGQAVPPGRHPLRQDRTEFHGVRACGRRQDPVAVTLLSTRPKDRRQAINSCSVFSSALCLYSAIRNPQSEIP